MVALGLLALGWWHQEGGTGTHHDGGTRMVALRVVALGHISMEALGHSVMVTP